MYIVFCKMLLMCSTKTTFFYSGGREGSYHQAEIMAGVFSEPPERNEK